MNMKTLCAAAVLAVAGSAASAATCTGSWTAGPKEKTTEFTVEQYTPTGSTVTAQCYNDANDSESLLAGLFGVDSWTLGDKSDNDEVYGDLDFTTAPVDGTMSGNWAIDDNVYSSVMLVLKAGDTFGAFLLTAAEYMAGEWFTDRGLSHASVYYGGTPQPAPIPLPAAGFLLLGGLGGMAMLRRRKKA